ncbi:MAG TPA: 50S ribosomal protein L31 [Candidatus Paceibacterota bacterium]|nr:50S ribosomal protein L31 [Candidatus Paceibacterota bacterium]
MKADIHPVYHPKASVSCACGNAFNVGSTRESLSVGICAACHPFYTGKEKLLDTRGRVEKFKKRMEKAASASRKAK